MALKIRNLGNRDLIGDIQPGWSIDENATPHVIGDGSASVGGVQFSAARRDDSEFLLNKAVTVYYEPEGTVATGNNVSGSFDTVDAAGASVGVTSTNLLSRLTAQRTAEATYAGVFMAGRIYNPSVENAGLTGQIFAFVRNAAGDYYVGNGTPVNTFVKYSADGDYSGFVFGGNAAETSLSNIIGMAYDPNNKIIYAISGSGQVIGYAESGNVTTYFSVILQTGAASSIAVMPNGDILVGSGTALPGVFRYTNQGTFLAKYGTTGTGNGQFQSVRKIATDSAGNIYVIDENQTTYAPRLQKLGPTGAYITQWALPAGYINPSLSVEPGGSVYVMGTSVTATAFRGTKYSTTGTSLFQFAPSASSGGLSSAVALYATSSGFSVMGSGPAGGVAEGYTMVNYSSTGAELSRFNTGIPSESTFFGGRGMAIANGYIYVSNRRANKVARYTQDAQFTSSHNLSNINSIDSDTAGNVYAFSVSTNPTIYTFTKYDADLNFISSWSAIRGTAAGQLDAAQDFAVAANGDIYVLESNNTAGATFSRVSVFTNSGTFIRSFGAYGTGAGQFANASALAVDTNYNTYVRSNSVVKYNSSGVQTLRFEAPNGGTTGVGSSIRVSTDGIYVTGAGSQSVDYYSPTGVLRQRFTGFGDAEFNSPTAMFVADGRISVYNSGSGDILQAMGETIYLKTAFDYYVGLIGGINLDFQGADPTVTYPRWTDSVWTKLNELCAATGKEIVLQNDSLVVRDLVTSTINIDDVEASPSTSLDSTAAARYLNVVNQNTSVVNNGVVFDYMDDNGRAISADIGETVTTTIETDVWLTSIQQPVFQNLAGGKYPSDGRFIVYTASGQAIDIGAFQRYGMELSVTINPDGRSLDITLVGPYTQVGAFEGPYTVGSLVGDGTKTGISIIGSGVRVNPQDVLIATGADWSKVTTEDSQTIDNPFITNAALVYDRGMWASDAMNGVAETINLSVPVWRIGGLGVTPGATFIYRKARWRVLSAKFTNSTVNIDAARYTTVGEHDALYSGQTMGQHDTTLAALTLGDSAIKPLY